MKLGKLTPNFLEGLLSRVTVEDPRVILGPKVGEDAALLDFGDEVLVAKTDPITFATDLIGWYAVQVNANDVACAGAPPRWFMATLLLPQGMDEEGVSEIFRQITQACRSLGVTLVGGHTEVTHNLDKPIVVGCMLGVAPKGKALTTAGAEVGDYVILTKGVSLEGSALLARERDEALREGGMDPAMIEEAAGFLFDPGISVVKDARVACDAVNVHSLHDPTEGGLATGLQEVASAAGVGMVVDRERIPFLPQCVEICNILKLDPLGLLASGSLIITLRPDEAPQLLSALDKESIDACQIGRITPPEEGVMLREGGKLVPMPTFERDELARYFEESP